MSSHTPTPWFAVNDGTDEEPMMVIKAPRIAGGNPTHCVAIVATGDSCQEMENANASLIAKAVNSYEETQVVMDMMADALVTLRTKGFGEAQLKIDNALVALSNLKGEA